MAKRRLTLARTAPLLLFALGSLPPCDLRAQPSPPPPREETFFDTVDVDVVSIEVVVTDREGRAVTGLAAEDFELLENGRKMEVTHFYAEEEGTQTTSSAQPPARSTAPPRGAPDDDRRLYLGVFVDNRSLTARSRNRALGAMRGFLGEGSRPEDRFVLATYDGGLRIRQGPTGDPSVIDALFADLSRAGSGGEPLRELDRLLREMDRASLPTAAGAGGDGADKLGLDRQDSSKEEAESLHAAIRLFAQRRNAEVSKTIEALGQFIDSLAGLPGRKAVLFVSGGLPLRPSEPLLLAMQKKYAAHPGLNQANLLDVLTFDVTADMQRLLAKANANRVTFYSLAALEEARPQESDGLLWSPDLAGNARLADVGPLQRLAAATGGFAALDPIDPGPLLARMQSDLATYYSLGYVSPESKSGRTQKIEVKVKRPGTVVRHRENYLAKTGGERSRDRTYSAMLLGETRNLLGAAVDLGEQTRTGSGDIELEVMVRVPLANLVLLPLERFHEGRVSVFIGSRDGQGRNSRITQVLVPIRIPNEQLMTALGQSAGYQTKLLLRPEPHQLAIGVRDELGNNDATLLATFEPTGLPPRDPRRENR